MATTTKETSPLENIKFLQVVKRGWVTRGNSAMRARASSLQVLLNLETLTRILESEWKCKLPRVPLEDLKAVKEFCDGILDTAVSHPWRTSLYKKHLGLRARSSICASLFLFRKSLPEEKLDKKTSAKLIRQYVKKMSTPQDSPESGIMQFASNIVRTEFPLGWDSSWYNNVDNFTLPVKSCLENRASAGGARGLHSSETTKHFFKYNVLDSEMGHFRRDFFSDDGSCITKENGVTRPMNIWTGGKNRLVTCFSWKRSFLAPVHNTIYDHLSKKEWLLRGDATSERFKKFLRKEGEVFVSGDYKNASDDLNLHLSRLLLVEMSKTSTRIPPHVWISAISALEATFESGETQKRGQLMGSLLSFPLLCLTNYVAFKYYVRRDVPVRINGDDIVFRCTRQEADRWMDGVQRFGLTLSRGKTLVDNTLFSINSTFFLGSPYRIQFVPLLRSSCIFVKAEDAASLSGKVHSASDGFSRQTKESVNTHILRTNSKHIWASQRSVIRGLRCKVNFSTLVKSGLAEREAMYSSLHSEPDLPAPYKRWQHWPIPTGWTAVKTDDQKAEDDFGYRPALISSCWDPCWSHADISRSAYLVALKKGTLSYVKFPKRKFFKMLGSNPYLYKDLATKITPHRSDKRKTVWRQTVGKPRTVTFVRGK